MLFEKVKEVIVDTLGCDEADVTMEATLSDDLGADSLDAVELNMALEEEFGISIADEKLKELKTVADVIACVEELQA